MAKKKKAKLKKFKVNYTFDGNGSCIVVAKNKKEAERKFRTGDFEEKNDAEWGENYFVGRVEKY
jgi:hypothetical protein